MLCPSIKVHRHMTARGGSMSNNEKRIHKSIRKQKKKNKNSHESNAAQEFRALAHLLRRLKGALIVKCSMSASHCDCQAPKASIPSPSNFTSSHLPSSHLHLHLISINASQSDKRKDGTRHFTHPSVQKVFKLRHGQRMLLHRIVKRILILGISSTASSSP